MLIVRRWALVALTSVPTRVLAVDGAKGLLPPRVERTRNRGLMRRGSPILP
jgi:hypothetical protein